MIQGIYIHIPFCITKCGYCSFYSETDLSLADIFLSALEKELEQKKTTFPDFFTDDKEATLYIGGGNPAILTEHQTERLFKILETLPFTIAEKTIEANPENITSSKACLYKDLGVTRVSMGIQSFNDNVLGLLQRNHRSSTAFKASETLGRHFDNFSIDLIGGVPSCERNWESELTKLKSTGAPHVSFYLLFIEEESRLHKIIKLDEELQHKDYGDFCRFMEEENFRHYEVSNYCKPGFECMHNNIYWDRKEYMGLGPSAVSALKFKETDIRMKNVPDLKSYIRLPFLSEIEHLDRNAVFLESLFLPLRTDRGIDTGSFRFSFPERAARLEENIKELAGYGFIEEKEGRWVIPERHYLISNEIILKLVKDTSCA